MADAVASWVVDASALLAYLHDEPGGEVVHRELGRAAVGTVNWSEVVQKALSHGVDVDGLRGELEAFGLAVVDLTAADAEDAANLWSVTRHLGLSLADRACLPLGRRLGVPILTADRSWADLPADVASIRPIR